MPLPPYFIAYWQARDLGRQEIRVRILTEPEAADRYLLSGPVCYQAAVPLGAEVNEVKLGSTVRCKMCFEACVQQ